MLVAGIEYVMVCANDGDRICTSIKKLFGSSTTGGYGIT